MSKKSHARKKKPAKTAKSKKSRPATKPKSARVSKGTDNKAKDSKANRKPRKKRNKPSITVTKQRGKNTVSYDFNHVRSIDKKFDLFNNANDGALDRALRKNKKPPKGVVIIVKGKKGKMKVIVSPPDFVVNKKNVKAYTKGILEKIREDWEERDFENAEGDDTEEGYEESNPNQVSGIDIKIIY